MMNVYTIMLSDDSVVEVAGNPECRQYGALFMTNEYGAILELFAPGTWKHLAVKHHDKPCPTCGSVK